MIPLPLTRRRGARLADHAFSLFMLNRSFGAWVQGVILVR